MEDFLLPSCLFSIICRFFIGNVCVLNYLGISSSFNLVIIVILQVSLLSWLRILLEDILIGHLLVDSIIVDGPRV